MGSPLIRTEYRHYRIDELDRPARRGQWGDERAKRFSAALNDEGTLVMTGYLGGSLDDIGLDVAMNDTDDILITGSTNSYLFPGALNSFCGGDRDSFLAKLPAIDLAYADLLVNITADSVTAEQGKTASVPIRIDNAGRADAIAYGPGYFTTTLKLADALDADCPRRRRWGLKLASLARAIRWQRRSNLSRRQTGRYYGPDGHRGRRPRAARAE
jgi:hypothetical protein